jgi:hypothetical protein
VFGRDWEGGTALIVARRNTVHQVASAPIYEYVADISPDSATPAFRATIDSPTILDYSKFQPPDVGDSVRVKFHPKSRKVKFDKSDPTLDARPAAQAARAEFESLADLPPGAVPAGASDGGPAPVEQLQKLADPHDRGALTDAEFAAEKAKLLSES